MQFAGSLLSVERGSVPACDEPKLLGPGGDALPSGSAASARFQPGLRTRAVRLRPAERAAPMRVVPALDLLGKVRRTQPAASEVAIKCLLALEQLWP